MEPESGPGEQAIATAAHDAPSRWPVVAGAMLAQMFTIGFYSYAFSFLVLPLQAEFGATRAEVMYAMTASTLAGFLLAPLLGTLVDRHPPRLLMCAATLVYAGGLWLLSASPGIGVFIAVFALTMALPNNLLGVLLINPLVSRCFVATRGRALGIAALGPSLGGFLAPPAFVYLLEQFGWRGGVQIYAAALLLVLLPVLWLAIRGVPRPDAQARPTTSGPGGGNGFAAILVRREYWLIGIPVGLSFCTIAGVLANFTPYLVSVGLPANDAAGLLIASPVGGVIGKLLFGHAADRFDKRKLLLSALLLMFGGVMLLALVPSRAGVLCAMLAIGMASGATSPTWGALLPQVFGLAAYGRVMGAMAPLITLLVTGGFALAGISFDATGSYLTMLWSFAAALAVGALLLAALDLRPRG